MEFILFPPKPFYLTYSRWFNASSIPVFQLGRNLKDTFNSFLPFAPSSSMPSNLVTYQILCSYLRYQPQNSTVHALSPTVTATAFKQIFLMNVLSSHHLPQPQGDSSCCFPSSDLHFQSPQVFILSPPLRLLLSELSVTPQV